MPFHIKITKIMWIWEYGLPGDQIWEKGELQLIFWGGLCVVNLNEIMKTSARFWSIVPKTI